MALTRFQRFKNWAYETLKSRPARYLTAGITGLGAAATTVGICGFLSVALVPTVIIGGVVFVIVSVVTNKQISASIEAHESVAELEKTVLKQQNEIESLKEEHKQTTEVATAAFQAVTLLTNDAQNSKTKKDCEKLLCGEKLSNSKSSTKESKKTQLSLEITPSSSSDSSDLITFSFLSPDQNSTDPNIKKQIELAELNSKEAEETALLLGFEQSDSETQKVNVKIFQ